MPSISATFATALVAFFLSLKLVLATPVPVGLARRGPYPNEMLYLSDCAYGSARYSSMLYYQNGRSGSQHGEVPDDVSDFSSLVTWEGKSISAEFHDTGCVATSKIASNAKSLANYKYAGPASNSYGQGFNCYKDNGHAIFTLTGGETCYSRYYCFDSN